MTWVITLSCLYPGLTSAKVYNLTVAGARLEFAPQAEKGYVVKLAEKARGVHALAEIPALGTEGARAVGGSDRQGVYTVENQGPPGRNEETLRLLRTNGQAAYAAPLFSSNGETVAIIPEIVIRVNPGVDARQVHFLCQSAGLRVIKPMEFTTQEYLLEVLGPDAETVFAAVAQLSQASEVEWACPNTAFRPRLPTPAPSAERQAMPASDTPAGQVRIAAAGEDANRPGVFPNDPYFAKQWHLHNTGQSGGTPGADIRAPEAWEITTGDPNIVVAVVGGGVDTHHPDLVNNLVPGYDFFEDDNTPDPGNGGGWEDAHDTVCAGMIAAQGDNGIGLAGVAYTCRIMPVRVASATAWLKGSQIATSLRWAATNGADILSNSWTWSTNPTPNLYSAIVDVTKPGGLGRGGKGCLVVFCAGNGGGAITDYPPKYPEVLTVGATDHNDARWTYSACGPELDVVAPSGCDGTWCGQMATFWCIDQTGAGGYSDRNSDTTLLDYGEYCGGTSVSCPIVAGVAALILSIEPHLSPDEVRHFLERSARDLGERGRDDSYGWGRVDARAALDMVLARRADLNNDWKVDAEDKAVLLGAIEVNDLSADIAPAARRDGVVDEQDLELLTRYLGVVMPELGLVAHWKLDEEAGMIVHDSEGQHDATVIGVPLWQPEGGKVDGALQLTGVTNFVSVRPPRDPSQGPMSVFAWVQGGQPGQVIVSQVGVADWLRADPATGALATSLGEVAGSGKMLTSQTVITDGAWHRVGLVWDGTNRVLYVDDVEVARDTQPALAGSAANLTFGTGSTFTPGSFWKGLIDDIRLYDRAVEL